MKLHAFITTTLNAVTDIINQQWLRRCLAERTCYPSKYQVSSMCQQAYTALQMCNSAQTQT